MKQKDGENCKNCRNMGNRSLCEYFWIYDDEICENYDRKKEEDDEQNKGG